MSRKRVLIFVVSYNAEKTIQSVLGRVPRSLFDEPRYSTDILVIDDCSKDQTFATGYQYKYAHGTLPLTILKNPRNLGYGGNQKLGYNYAIACGYDVVALLHGDGQYAPEELPKLLEPLINGECEAVFGSRMSVPGRALAGGMPKYKYVGNKILTRVENAIIGASLSEWHSGYRLYSVKTLASIPFEYNADYFDFDTDIIIQLCAIGARIRELPIPTFYGDEISHVNGTLYAMKIVRACIQYRLQQLGLFYDRKFDIAKANSYYQPKFHFRSSHSMGLDAVEPHDKLLLFGSGPAELVAPFKNKAASVTAIDQYVTPELEQVADVAIQGDLDELEFSSLPQLGNYTKILALDVIEHLRSPETFLTNVRNSFPSGATKLILTTPNVAFLPIRLMLLLGSFNYGKRGILDMTHTRLFTFRSLRKLLQQHGFEVTSLRAVPAPFPLALKSQWLGRTLLAVNRSLNVFLRGMFSYQIYCEARPRPTTSYLLELAKREAQCEVNKQLH